MFNELEFNEDSVRYVVFPTIVVEADDEKMFVGIEWMKWGMGITFIKNSL